MKNFGENGFSRFSLLLSFLIPTIGFAAPASIPGELIIKLRDSGEGVRVQSMVSSMLISRLGEDSVKGVESFKTDASLMKVKLAKGMSVSAAIDALRAEPSVKYAEPNWVMQAFADVAEGAPNDPDFDKLWGLRNFGQPDSAGQVGSAGADINILPLWKAGFTGSKDILVAVIDTGVEWAHPDLKDNVWTNPGEAGDKANNGKDDDANGFIDDVHGWNFNTNNNNSNDDHNHGTHVAGTIGASGNNAVGVAGVAWNVSIIPIKFLGKDGSGTLQGAIESINYARLAKAHIMSNSWGGGGFSQAMQDAIVAARDAGIVFVAAAGNDGTNNDSSPTYPSSYPVENVISVAATNNQDKIAGFSNFGVQTVHVAAPGVKIHSTVREGKYLAYSGTSMATPHISGVAAVLLAANPTWTVAELKERLIKTSDPVSGLRRKVASKGRVNAYNAFHGIVPPGQDPDESLWKDMPKVIESEHPYKNNVDTTFTIDIPGAKYIRVHFEKIAIENNYDKIFIKDKDGNVLEQLTGKVNDYMADFVIGGRVDIQFKTDSSSVDYGFRIDRIQVIQ